MAILMHDDPLGLRCQESKSTLPALTEPFADQFKVQISTVQRAGVYYGNLKVVRRTDGRVLFPFDGAPALGPFKVKEDAREAVICAARKAVADDLANPET